MATFLMFGKYTSEALRGISPERTEEAVGLIQRCGGEVEAMYATLGPYDLVFILTFPGIEGAMKASVALSKLTGIGFTTAPAISTSEFDTLLSQ